MDSKVKVSNSWKKIKKVLVKVNGSWKTVRLVYGKENGSWKLTYASMPKFYIRFDTNTTKRYYVSPSPDNTWTHFRFVDLTVNYANYHDVSALSEFRSYDSVNDANNSMQPMGGNILAIPVGSTGKKKKVLVKLGSTTYVKPTDTIPSNQVYAFVTVN